jgi:hypothetical protein
MMLEREALWRIVVESKYGSSWGGSGSNEVYGPCGVGLWKNIRRCLEDLFSYTRFKVGDGSKIKFRRDLWCRD